MNDIVAAVLVDVPAGASSAVGACSVATVVMLDNGKGDRPAESSGVKVSVRLLSIPGIRFAPPV